MQRAVESCEALELDDPLRPKLLELLGDVGAALPCPPCCAGLITRHPLAAGDIYAGEIKFALRWLRGVIFENES